MIAQHASESFFARQAESGRTFDLEASARRSAGRLQSTANRLSLAQLTDAAEEVCSQLQMGEPYRTVSVGEIGSMTIAQDVGL